MKIIKDFDLYSPQWLEITFNTRNKTYGAYELRNDSSNRHIKAIIVVFFVGLFAIFLPKVVERLNIGGGQEVTQDDGVKTVLIKETDVEKPKEEVRVEEVPPPPIVKATVRVTNYSVTRDEEVDPTEQKTDTELKNLDEEFGEKNQEGENLPPEVDPTPLPVPEPDPVPFPDIKAEPPGGMAALQRWLAENLSYPQDATEDNVQGTVIVQFVVKADGRIDNVTILKKVHPSLDNEAIRVVKKMENWKPGKTNNIAVPSYYQLPVQFKLQQKR